MHVIDVVLVSFSNLFRSHRYSPLEKIYSVFLFMAGLSLRGLSERLCLTGASRESVRMWVHGFSSLFRPSRRVRRLVAVDETGPEGKWSGLLPCTLILARYWPYTHPGEEGFHARLSS
jgi:hypothetical protein